MPRHTETRTSERSVAVLIPVLDRPDAVRPVLASLNASVELERSTGWTVEPLFVCSPGDTAEISAVRTAGLEPLLASWAAGPGDYARKINHAARSTGATWLFTGADDLRFHPGWLRACTGQYVRTGRRVIGTNDLGNPWVMRGMYATHLLVHRSYMDWGTVDEPGLIYHEGYDHNCVDTELVETARSRREFVFAKNARVEHLHPSWKKSELDATYRKGRARYAHDRRLLERRRELWRPSVAHARRLRAVR